MKLDNNFKFSLQSRDFIAIVRFLTQLHNKYKIKMLLEFLIAFSLALIQFSVPIHSQCNSTYYNDTISSQCVHCVTQCSGCDRLIVKIDNNKPNCTKCEMTQYLTQGNICSSCQIGELSCEYKKLNTKITTQNIKCKQKYQLKMIDEGLKCQLMEEDQFQLYVEHMREIDKQIQQLQGEIQIQISNTNKAAQNIQNLDQQIQKEKLKQQQAAAAQTKLLSDKTIQQENKSSAQQQQANLEAELKKKEDLKSYVQEAEQARKLIQDLEKQEQMLILKENLAIQQIQTINHLLDSNKEHKTNLSNAISSDTIPEDQKQAHSKTIQIINGTIASLESQLEEQQKNLNDTIKQKEQIKSKITEQEEKKNEALSNFYKGLTNIQNGNKRLLAEVRSQCQIGEMKIGYKCLPQKQLLNFTIGIQVETIQIIDSMSQYLLQKQILKLLSMNTQNTQITFYNFNYQKSTQLLVINGGITNLDNWQLPKNLSGQKSLQILKNQKVATLKILQLSGIVKEEKPLNQQWNFTPLTNSSIQESKETAKKTEEPEPKMEEPEPKMEEPEPKMEEPEPKTEDTDNDVLDNSLSTGAIVGIVLGVLFVIIIIAAILFYFCRDSEEETTEANQQQKPRTDKGKKPRTDIQQNDIISNPQDNYCNQGAIGTDRHFR